MSDNLDFVYYSILIVVLGIFVFIFGIQSWRHKRSAHMLLSGMICGLAATIFDFLYSFMTNDNPLTPVLNALQINFYTFMIFYWYIHLERVLSLKVNSQRYGFIIILTSITITSVWFIHLFQDTPAVREFLWVIVDLCLNLLGLFVFLGMGLYIHSTIYRYSKTLPNLIMLLVYLCIGSGFGLILFSEYCTWPAFSGIIILIGNIGYLMPLIGLFLLMAIYSIKPDQIYQLPFDVYGILIAYKQSGNLINAVSLESKKSLTYDNHLISSLLVAMNGLFGEIFTGKKNIQNIAGTHASLIFEVGQNTIAIVITDRTSFYLVQSLKNYEKDFERKFKVPLGKENANLKIFQEVDEILQQNFPYCKRVNLAHG